MSDQKESAVIQRAGEFTMRLVKGLLQTGYYTLSHPSGRLAVAELYTIFKELMKDAYDITYALVSTVEESGIVMDGLTPEPLDIARSLRNVMGDHYISKLHEYFVRNEIASFTIKHYITKPEFEKFVSIWVSWAQKKHSGAGTTERMSDELTDEGILAVTVVGLDEVPGAIRHLPWPVKVALGRLRKDLSRLPLLKGVSEEVIAGLKAQVIMDVVRPLSKPHLIRDLLIHSDLIVEGLEGISRDDVVELMLSGMRDELLLETGPAFLDLLATLKTQTGVHQGRDVAEVVADAEQMAIKLFSRLARKDVSQAYSLLLDAHSQGLIPFEELPAEVRQEVKAIQLTERFISEAETYLSRFTQCTERKEYQAYIEAFKLILKELISGEKVEPRIDLVLKLLAILKEHLLERPANFTDRALHAQKLLEHVTAGGLADSFILQLVHAPKQLREMGEPLLPLFGQAIVPVLVRILLSSEDVSARRSAVVYLIALGKLAVPSLMDELRSHRRPWYVVRNIMEVLRELRAREAVPVILEYADHPKEKLREAVLVAVHQILDAEAGPYIERMLHDPDQMIQRRAIQALAALGYTRESFLRYLYDTVRLRLRSEPEPPEDVQLSAMKALASLPAEALEGQFDFIDALINVVEPPKARRLLPGRLGIRPKDRDLRVMAILILARLENQRASRLVRGLAESNEGPLGDAARKALARQRSEVSREEPGHSRPVW